MTYLRAVTRNNRHNVRVWRAMYSVNVKRPDLYARKLISLAAERMESFSRVAHLREIPRKRSAIRDFSACRVNVARPARGSIADLITEETQARRRNEILMDIASRHVVAANNIQAERERGRGEGETERRV